MNNWLLTPEEIKGVIDDVIKNDDYYLSIYPDSSLGYLTNKVARAQAKHILDLVEERGFYELTDNGARCKFCIPDDVLTSFEREVEGCDRQFQQEMP